MIRTSTFLFALAFAAPAEAQLYGRISAGVSAADDMDQRTTYCPCIALAGDSFAKRQMRSAGAGYAIDGALGWSFSDALAAELVYRHASADIDTISEFGGFSERLGPLSPVYGSTDKLTADAMLASVRFTLPPLDFAGSPAPFLSAGVGAARIDAGRGDDTEGAGQLGAGFSWRLGAGRSLALELDHLRTGPLTFGPKTFGAFGPIGPRLTGGHYTATSFRVGLEQRF